VDAGHLADLIEASDLDELVRFVDGVCTARDWDGLVEVRDRCREAVTRGKQLWGVAIFAEYRMARDAPAELAGSVVVDAAGRTGLGPLWEVAASTHSLEDLAPHVSSHRQRVLVAHERLLRGEAAPQEYDDRSVVDVPLQLAPWEPTYPVAVYRSDRADFPEMDLPEPEWTELGSGGVPFDDEESCDALTELVKPWVEESNGRAEAVAVEGTAESAIRAMGPHRVRIVRITGTEALAMMTWAAASGGGYGRRRGSVIGRLLAWRTVAVLAGLETSDAGLMTEAAVGGALEGLEFWRWDPADQVGGWGFHLAAALPAENLAWAVSAVDAR
jgi:hypothetical protein